MAEIISIPESKDRKEIYMSLIPQIKALVQDEPDLIANMANVSAVIKMAFDFFWIGFYIVRENELVLGPFQGPVACTRIKKGKGVCGTVWQNEKSLIVPDVDKFPGHIACSADSKSEIVIPGIINNRLAFVLDIDSNKINDFSEIDLKYLTLIINDLVNASNLY